MAADQQEPEYPPDNGPEPLPSNKPKVRKLTRKEEKLARSIVKNPNAPLSEHGDNAGYAEGCHKNVKAVGAWNALQREHVKARIRALMNKRKDTSLEGLHKTLSEGLKAKEVKFFQHEGKVTAKRVTVDHGTRHRYLETALELHGAREKEVGGNVTNNFFTKDAMEAFVAAFKRPPAA